MSEKIARLSVPLHTILLLASVGLAYWWLHIPSLQYYSLQVFVVSLLAYFAMKRLGKAKLWHFFPSYISLEMVIATFAFLLLIGSTGNFASPFYFLTFIHLFFLVFSSKPITSSIVTAAIMLFHYGLAPHSWFDNIGTTLSIPIILLFLLLAKKQHEEIIRERDILLEEEATVQQLSDDKGEIEAFLEQLSQSKLKRIRQLAEYAAENQAALLGQISILEIEIERLLKRLRSS